MNSIYESCNSMLINDHTTDTEMLRHEIVNLIRENERIIKHNDDVQSKLST